MKAPDTELLATAVRQRAAGRLTGVFPADGTPREALHFRALNLALSGAARLAKMPAETVPGVLAKLKVAMDDCCIEERGFEEDQPNMNLLRSVVADLERMAGGAA